MSKRVRRARVRHYDWTNPDSTTIPTIRIDIGSGFAIIPYDIARQVVDQVHDLCDDHEREQRKQTRPQ